MYPAPTSRRLGLVGSDKGISGDPLLLTLLVRCLSWYVPGDQGSYTLPHSHVHGSFGRIPHCSSIRWRILVNPPYANDSKNLPRNYQGSSHANCLSLSVIFIQVATQTALKSSLVFSMRETPEESQTHAHVPTTTQVLVSYGLCFPPTVKH